MKAGLVEKYQATLLAARLKVLLLDLKVTLLSAIFGSRLANGVYFCPFVTKSQWISSESTGTRCSRQISPMRVMSSADQQFPVGFCGLQRMKA